MKDSSSLFIWLILIAVFVSSFRHIYEAVKKRDHAAIGEGIGTMLFSGAGILLKLIS